MVAPGTAFAGPLISGPRANTNAQGQPANQGVALLTQRVTLTQNSTAVVSATMTIPNHSQIVTFLVDDVTAWNSATSAVLSIGTTAAATNYVSALNVTASGRLTPTFTTTQLQNMFDTGANASVVATVTPTGATSSGSTTITMQYIQTVNFDAN
jgi:hypothetical protein